MKKTAAIGITVLLFFSVFTTPILAFLPILNPRQGLNKQSFQLNQIISRASKQDYGNITVYSTVGLADQNTLDRWNRAEPIWIHKFVIIKNWWWIQYIPRYTKFIMVSESEFGALWPRYADKGGLFVYPNEIWIKGFYRGDMLII